MGCQPGLLSAGLKTLELAGRNAGIIFVHRQYAVSQRDYSKLRLVR
jgi:hypothetical protein